MLNSIPPATGRLLISEPFMRDPGFMRSVIILTEYSAEGAAGMVLNHQSEYVLGDVLPEVSYAEIPVYIGGPVGNDNLHFIHHCPDKIPGGIEVCEGVFWGGDFEIVKDLIAEYQLKEDEIKFFIGYSGWSAGQLDDELKEGSWIVSDKCSPEILFNNDEQDLWRRVIISLGQRYAHIANFPQDFTLN
jgi:putative transcriptional regulator